MTAQKPQLRREHVHEVKRALSAGHWLKGREIEARSRIPTRLIRAVAEDTGQVISGPNGYKLIACASNEEIELAIADLESRIKHLQARADRHRAYLNGDPETGDRFL